MEIFFKFFFALLFINWINNIYNKIKEKQYKKISDTFIDLIMFLGFVITSYYVYFVLIKQI